jgi:hypothetical protein
MAAKGAAVDGKGLLQDADTIDEDEDGTTYIVVKEEYRQHVFGRSRVTMLPRLVVLQSCMRCGRTRCSRSCRGRLLTQLCSATA